MKKISQILIAAANIALIAVVVWVYFARRSHGNGPCADIKPQIDTIYIFDTICIKTPVKIESRIIDTLLVNLRDTVTLRDTVFLRLRAGGRRCPSTSAPPARAGAMGGLALSCLRLRLSRKRRFRDTLYAGGRGDEGRAAYPDTAYALGPGAVSRRRGIIAGPDSIRGARREL